MLKAVIFNRFLTQGSSKCFIVLCDDNKNWVVRIKKKNKNSKGLFSEYLAGLLSLQYGLNHPRVQLVEVGHNIFEELSKHENIFQESCRIGIATEFIEDLMPVSPPKNINYNSTEFPIANFNYISKLIKDKNQFSQLYGMKVFSDWIVLKDFHKYENLLLDKVGHIYFLDFDLAFMSIDSNDWNLPPVYDWIRMSSHQAPFWEGFRESEIEYQKWFEKIMAIEIESVKLEQIPSCWEIPKYYIENLLEFLFNNRELFIKEFQHAYNFRNDISKM